LRGSALRSSPRVHPLTGACVVLLAAFSAPAALAEDTANGARSFDAALGAARQIPRLYSLLASHDGELVLEAYFNGRDRNSIANVKSVSKSVLSALVGIAIEQGHIGLDQQIGDFFPGQLANDPAKAAITIEQLLTMQSGLETTSNRNYGAWVLSRSWVDAALARPLVDAPGTRMEYSTGNTHLLSAIITLATGRSTLEFARAHLSAPLGFRLAAWPRDPQGIYFGGNDMEMTPRQMIAFGELFLNGGRGNGRQIVSEDWVEASFVPRGESSWQQDRWYGYGWWLGEMAGYDTVYAWGYGGQYVVLVPELDLVIVTTSGDQPGADRRAQRTRIANLIEHHVIAPVAGAL
jgi:CubicO group peptidase (beta-lactamase class C family)